MSSRDKHLRCGLQCGRGSLGNVLTCEVYQDEDLYLYHRVNFVYSIGLSPELSYKYMVDIILYD